VVGVEDVVDVEDKVVEEEVGAARERNASSR